jgi:hypothetical protein
MFARHGFEAVYSGGASLHASELRWCTFTTGEDIVNMQCRPAERQCWAKFDSLIGFTSFELLSIYLKNH